MTGCAVGRENPLLTDRFGHPWHIVSWASSWKKLIRFHSPGRAAPYNPD
ncbi:hypothetical protein JK191_03135 [Gluconobacter sphaericus]|nr:MULTISPECIES: hypothetical protein [Gluconobacter]MBF0862135.1 hypothetical protein [Gluconobacter kanchanaburiensis]MBS1096575.1 hypothetical protein [Gluconobacter sphaericus]